MTGVYQFRIGISQRHPCLADERHEPIDLNSAALGIGRHASGIADPFNGRIDEFHISHVQRSDRWSETTWNNMSDPRAFAAAGAEEQEGGDGEPPPLALVWPSA